MGSLLLRQHRLRMISRGSYAVGISLKRIRHLVIMLDSISISSTQLRGLGFNLNFDTSSSPNHVRIAIHEVHNRSISKIERLVIVLDSMSLRWVIMQGSMFGHLEIMLDSMSRRLVKGLDSMLQHWVRVLGSMLEH